jgi:hypothetical protein
VKLVTSVEPPVALRLGTPVANLFSLVIKNCDVDEMIQRFEPQENSVHCQRLAIPLQNYDLDSDRPPNLQIPD